MGTGVKLRHGYRALYCILMFKHVGLDKTKYAFGDWIYRYYQRTNPRTRLGSSVTVNWPTTKTYIEFGGAYQYASKMELRAKVDNKGILAAGLTHMFAKHMKVSVAAQLDAK